MPTFSKSCERILHRLTGHRLRVASFRVRKMTFGCVVAAIARPNTSRACKHRTKVNDKTNQPETLFPPNRVLHQPRVSPFAELFSFSSSCLLPPCPIFVVRLGLFPIRSRPKHTWSRLLAGSKTRPSTPFSPPSPHPLFRSSEPHTRSATRKHLLRIPSLLHSDIVTPLSHTPKPHRNAFSSDGLAGHSHFQVFS